MADEEKTKTTPQPPPPDTPQSIKLKRSIKAVSRRKLWGSQRLWG